MARRQTTRQNDLVLIRYTGNQRGKFSIRGPSTGGTYRFSSTKPVRSIDRRDLEGLVARRDFAPVYEGESREVEPTGDREEIDTESAEAYGEAPSEGQGVESGSAEEADALASLPDSVRGALRMRGLYNVNILRSMGDDELLAVPGIGQATLERIREVTLGIEETEAEDEPAADDSGDDGAALSA
ncbi:MAG: hypothetical protein ACOC9T_01160 [Myxococcota bacterium]